MATIRKRGTRWQAQIRRQGFPTLSKSFAKKSDAAEWARHWEAKADRNELPVNSKVLNSITLGQLVQRYRDEVVPTKRGAVIETIILDAILRDPICRLRLSVLATSDFATYRGPTIGYHFQQVLGSATVTTFQHVQRRPARMGNSA